MRSLRRIAVLASMLVASIICLAAEGRTANVFRPWEELYAITVSHGRWFVVGSRGAILLSTDQGKTWDRLKPLADLDLYSIAFGPKGDVGWIVGEDGVIFHSNDRGETWHQQKSPVKTELLKVAVFGPQRACAVGDDGVLAWTSDAGEHWQAQRFEQQRIMFDVTIVGSQAWAVGEYHTILHSIDGCQTWQAQMLGKKSYLTDPFFSVTFKDNQHGWVTGLGGGIFSTDDGGQHWTESKLPTRASVYSSVYVPDTGDLILAGNGGAIMEGSGGNSPAPSDWRVKAPTLDDISDLAFSKQLGFAVGMNGTVLRSTNGGRTWEQIRD